MTDYPLHHTGDDDHCWDCTQQARAYKELESLHKGIDEVYTMLLPLEISPNPSVLTIRRAVALLRALNQRL